MLIFGFNAYLNETKDQIIGEGNLVNKIQTHNGNWKVILYNLKPFNVDWPP